MEAIAALARAITSRRMRLAVFDVGLRQRTGQWYLDTEIPVESIIERFADTSAFVEANGTIQVPLHEPDSAALTDAFLRVDPAAETAQFYDPGERGVRTIGISDLGSTYPAWQLRFWSNAYHFEETPPFMIEFAMLEEAPPTAFAGPSDQTPSMTDDAFFEAVRSTLVATRERRRERRRTTFQLIDTTEFIEDYGGIADVRPDGRSVDDYGQQVISLRIPRAHPLLENPETDIQAETQLNPGDEVIVDSPDVEALPVEAELFAIDETGLELGVYWDSARGTRAESAFDPDTEITLTVGKLIDGRRFSATAAAIDTVDRTDHARKRYAGTIEASFVDRSTVTPALGLNRDQQHALERALTAESILCVHTPPWTGARRLIWELARSSIELDERVLVLVPDEEALDILLRETHEKSTSFSEFARAEAFDVSVVRPPGERVPTGTDVIVAPIAAAGAIDDHSVDLAIVDQAARIDVPSGAIPFAKAGRVVLFGDPWQGAPPTSSPKYGSDIPRSIYDHLTRSVPEATAALRCQYRMNQAIAQYPSREFYEGALVHGGTNRTWTIDSLDPLTVTHVPATPRETPTGSVYHDGEIEVILAEVESLLERGVSGEDIGILTPYSAQIGKIRVTLNELEDDLGKTIRIGGVDAFRCHNRDAVIVSFVGSMAPDLGERDEGAPLRTPEGLNVALTRAAKRLVLIADWTDFGQRSSAHASLITFLIERGFLDRDRD